jgi:cobalt-zinc-cadmium efflux system protein
MASDALVALGVAVAGGVMLLTSWRWLDPVVSLVIAAVIVFGTWSLIREALTLALAGVPTAIDRPAVVRYLAALPGVSDVHDVHIWGMSTTETALTAHLVRPGGEIDDALLHQACAELKARFQIHHATLQVEAGSASHACELSSDAVV